MAMAMPDLRLPSHQTDRHGPFTGNYRYTAGGLV